VHDGLFRKEEFTFDAETDTYTYPGSHVLQPLYRSTDNGVDRRHYVNRKTCRDCALRPQCTSDTFRKITRWTGEAVLDRMEARLALRPDILDRRRETVEDPFGSVKQ